MAYVKTPIGNIRGPQGPTGMVGPQGEQGVHGHSIWIMNMDENNECWFPSGLENEGMTTHPTFTNRSLELYYLQQYFGEDITKLSDIQVGDLVYSSQGYVFAVTQCDISEETVTITLTYKMRHRGPKTINFLRETGGEESLILDSIDYAENDWLPNMTNFAEIMTGDRFISANGYLYEITQCENYDRVIATLISSIVGPQGEQGVQGEKGIDGRPIWRCDEPGKGATLKFNVSSNAIDGFNTYWSPNITSSEDLQVGDKVITSDGYLYEISEFTNGFYVSTNGDQYETYDVNLTPLFSIVGPQGEKGDKGDTGEQGPQGEKGEDGKDGADGTMTFEDLTDEQKATLKGERGSVTWTVSTIDSMGEETFWLWSDEISSVKPAITSLTDIHPNDYILYELTSDVYTVESYSSDHITLSLVGKNRGGIIWTVSIVDIDGAERFTLDNDTLPYITTPEVKKISDIHPYDYVLFERSGDLYAVDGYNYENSSTDLTEVYLYLTGNLKGPKGNTGAAGSAGADGVSAGFGTPTATIDSSTGTPSVTVSASGDDTAKVFNFAFSGLKGEKGTTITHNTYNFNDGDDTTGSMSIGTISIHLADYNDGYVSCDISGTFEVSTTKVVPTFESASFNSGSFSGIGIVIVCVYPYSGDATVTIGRLSLTSSGFEIALNNNSYDGTTSILGHVWLQKK